MRDGRRRAVRFGGMLAVVLVVLSIGSLAWAARQPDRHAAQGLGGKWPVLLADGFDSGPLDTDRWTTCYWWGQDGCAINTNGELQWYQPDNVQIENGHLVLTARRESVVTNEGDRKEYTSGMVSTGRSVSDTDAPAGLAFTYGRVEVRAKLPEGKGLWPAFWLLPADHNSRPEIDVFEVLGDDTSTLRMHYHWGEERTSLGHNVAVADLSAGWHIYALDWSRDALVWYLDGVEQWRITDSEIIPDEPMYVILNLAVGGDYPGAPDAATAFPSSYLIDSVTVWQLPSS